MRALFFGQFEQRLAEGVAQRVRRDAPADGAALLRETFPAEKLNGAIGIWGGVIGASTAAGPIVGGLLVQHINWEACFYINVPVGIIALVFGLLVLRETPPSPAARSFDIPGTALLSGFLFLLVWALIKGASYGWGSDRTIGFFAAAVVALALFVVRELRTETPLLPLRLFRSVALSAGTVLTITLMFSLFGAMFFMTFFMENVHGLDPVATGVRLLPMTAMLIVGAPLAGLVITRIGPRVPMVAGMLIAAAALFGLSRIGLASGLNDTILWFALLGLGLSPVMVGATEVIVGNAPVGLAGVASGLQSTAMQVGGTIRHRGARRGHGRQGKQHAARQVGRGAPARAVRHAARRGQEPGHGRGRASPEGRPRAARGPHGERHAQRVHQRHDRLVPRRLRGRRRRRPHRPSHPQGAPPRHPARPRPLRRGGRVRAKIGRMDIDAALDYVRTQHHAVLSTLKSDGTPQLSPVTAGIDDAGHVVISTRQTAYKVRNVRRDPRVWLCAFPDRFYGQWVQIEGTADIVELPEAMDGLVDYYRRISGEHPDWDDYRAAMERDKRVLLRIAVTRAGPDVSG